MVRQATVAETEAAAGAHNNHSITGSNSSRNGVRGGGSSGGGSSGSGSDDGGNGDTGGSADGSSGEGIV